MAPVSRGATAGATPSGLPIYEFAATGSGPLPWNATSLEPALNRTTMLGAPHGASDATEGVLAYRTTSSQVALYLEPATGASQWLDPTPVADASPPADDPIPFFDPSGDVDVIYVDAFGNLILLTLNDPVTPLWHHLHHNHAWRPYVGTNLSAITGVTFANGLPSVVITGDTAVVAARTLTDTIEVMQLTWYPNEPIPYLASPAVNVSTLTESGTAASDPIVLPTPLPSVVTTSLSGDLELYSESSTSNTTTTTTTTTTTPTPTTTSTTTTSVPTTTTSVPAIPTWSVQNITQLTGSPTVHGPLAGTATASDAYIVALNASGDVEYFSAPISSALVAPRALVGSSTIWTALNLTAATPGAPPLSGELYISATPTQITVAGQALNWGDLFAITNTGPSDTWAATNVSVTAGSAARTIADAVTGISVGTTLQLFAAGISSPPPQGVGVYAIPSTDWSQAISDGWPIISETGGLGTQSAPWVNFTTATSVADSPDFLIGQSIYNSHKRVTWLSFWTVSGPIAGQPQTTSNYYNHGFAAGVWVATQIDQYRGLGVGLKPDWVILDPEGYPDDHSALDAPSGSSAATLATYATYWTAILQGWVQGIASVDPTLNAAVYANQSEYRNYDLDTQPLPVFVALSFSGGGPVVVPGATGSNVRGFIAFSAVCNPVSSLSAEESTLLNPPWAGQFNTLQFNANVYCPPAPT